MFLAAIRPLRLTASVAEVRAYLRTTARTVLAAHWRATMGREVTTIEDVAAPPESEQAISSAPQRVAAVLDALPDNYRTVLELRFLHGRAVKEVATEMGISVANAKVLQHRALRLAAAAQRGRLPMNRRDVDRYIDDLLAGRSPKPFTPDEFEAEQIRTAIDLTASRPGGDDPRPDFLTGLRARLAAEMPEPAAPAPGPKPKALSATRRQVIVGTTAAATAAVAAVSVDRLLVRPEAPQPPDGGEVVAHRRRVAPGRCQR